jgi:hypothetical protein
MIRRAAHHLQHLDAGVVLVGTPGSNAGPQRRRSPPRDT